MWLTPNFDGMLPEMKVLPNWVLAKAVQRDGKPTKVPCQPDGGYASVADAGTWSSFDQVQAAFDPAKYIGVGFMLDGAPHFEGRYLHGFDWDKCIADGQIDLTVVAKLSELNIPRVELSISGTGLRGFFLHDQPLPSRKTKIDGRSVEIYSNGRYLTTTGIALPGWEVLG